MTLSSNQKEQVLELFNDGVTNLNDITQTVFKNKNLDGRSREGRAVRSYLIEKGKEYNTSKSVAEVDAELNITQKSFLFKFSPHYRYDALEIARMTFEDEDIQSLSSHHRTVLEYLKGIVLTY